MPYTLGAGDERADNTATLIALLLFLLGFTLPRQVG
jgi:hypothetical protein